MTQDQTEQRRTRKSASPMWLIAGLVIGLVVAPAAAVAATLSVVNLAGPNGTKVAVTKSGQLLTTAAPLTSSRTFYHWDLDAGGTSTGCVKVFTAPAGESFVLQDASVDVWQDTTPGPYNNIQVATVATCSTGIADDNPPTVGSTQYDFGNGIVIPAGHSVYAIANGNVNGELYGYGYTVPVADAPGLSPAVAGTHGSDGIAGTHAGR